MANEKEAYDNFDVFTCSACFTVCSVVDNEPGKDQDLQRTKQSV